MFLRSLEIRGFKSFADKTELRFKKGVTAVVGPNGSGKSNVSDSVRWVLGEQSVKNLRGGKMEDVIFAGTQFRKPLGLAQVSLTLDNSDGELATEYNEVTVTRRIFRSGETEYLINNQKCRLKDITELFMDTGIGKEGYSIIGQGKIDAILSGKPEERRALLEEAAGIVKYKSRKEEAEKRLDNTDNNLVRIRDIISTYEERLEPLKVEKEKALKYKKLAEELNVKEVSVLVNYINKVSVDIEGLSGEIEKKQEIVDKKREKLKEFKEELNNLQKKIESLEKKNKLEKEEYYSKKEEYSNHTRDIELFNERINNFNLLIEKEEKEIQGLNDSLIKLNSEKKDLEESLNFKLQESKDKNDEIKQLESLINEITTKIEKTERELSAIKNSEYEIISKNSDINNNIQLLQKDIKNKNEIEETLELSLVSLEGNLAINVGTIEEFKWKLKNTREDISKLEEEVILVKKELSKTHSNLNNQDNKLKVLSKRINEAEATNTTLSNLEKHYEGYNRTVKNLMEHIEKGRVQGVNDIKVFGEIFEVEKKFETAIEIALGGAISNVITLSENDAKNLISYLKARGLGRATFLPMNIIKDKRDELVRNLNAEVKGKLASLTEEQLVIEQNNIEFQRKIRIREIVRELMIQKENLAKWIDNESIVDIYKEFTNTENLSYLDLPAILYLMIKLDGKKSSKEIKHIVIDEAQDYSMLQFIVLKELTGCKSYTIVGDSNQRLIKVEEEPAMLKLKSLFGGFVKNYALNKSYRSTFQIMEYASKLLDESAIVPFVRKGKFDVEEVEVKDEDDLIDTILETLEDYDDENYDNIAIITKDKEELKKIAPELKKFTKLLAFDREDVIYRGGKVIVPSYYAKGLEFDGVIIVNFDDNTDDLVKYIMATRALHRLKVVNYRMGRI